MFVEAIIAYILYKIEVIQKMGWNFRKSVKIAPGVKVNFSKRGTSISVGPKGYKVSVNSKGKVHQTTSIPGTGLYSRKKIADIGNSEKERSSAKITASKPKRKGKWTILKVFTLFLSIIFAMATFDLLKEGDLAAGFLGVFVTTLLLIFSWK